MAPVHQVGFVHIAILLASAWLLSTLVKSVRGRGKTTRLRGPPSKSLIYGVSKYLQEAKDAHPFYERWAEEYGPAFRMPTAMGGNQLVLCDPKAISHFYSKETYGYIQTPMSKVLTENMVGKGVLWAEGDSHKRQRKILNPAFSNAVIRNMSPIFFDSAYKVKEAWDTLLESSAGSEAVIDVQDWMNHVSLDSIGIAGFSHDFGTVHGKQSAIADVFDAFGRLKPSFLTMFTLIMSPAIPIVAHLPTPRSDLVTKFTSTAEGICANLLEKTKKEKALVGEGQSDRSVIGLLIKAANQSSELHLTDEEVMAQMKVLILAGYETTSITLTWALLELAKTPEWQTKLREELVSHFGSGGDPTYDQLNSGLLPYLDAVVHEILRLHAPLWVTTRISTADDVIPLSEPIQTADHKTVDRICIAAGQHVMVPIRTMNRSTSVWGPDAKEFKPERWLDDDGIPGKAKEIQGHRHLLTFVDGPRTCLGKGFALAEFKAVLSVLIRSYTFDLREPDMKLEMGRGILPRPKIAGEGCHVPLRIRRVE